MRPFGIFLRLVGALIMLATVLLAFMLKNPEAHMKTMAFLMLALGGATYIGGMFLMKKTG